MGSPFPGLESADTKHTEGHKIDVVQMQGPPTDAEFASPHAAAAYWSRVEAAATSGTVGPETASLLLHYALGGVQGETQVRQIPAPPSTVRALLASGADLTRDCWSFNLSPLHRAANMKDGAAAADLCRVLLDAGANVNDCRDSRQTPLHHAESVEVVLFLLGAGADASIVPESRDKESVLFSGAALRHGAACEALIAAGANAHLVSRSIAVWDLLGPHPLHLAESLEVVQALLRAGVKVRTLDTERYPVLCCPAARRDPAACRALVAAGADPAVVGLGPSLSPLVVAQTGDVVRAVLECGADPRVASRGRRLTALFSPAALADPEACATLVAAGADVNAVDSLGYTPLCRAVTGAVVEVLLRAGAVVQLPCGRHLSVLSSPAAASDAAVCRRLLAAGASLDAGVAYGHPQPLQVVQSAEVAEVLLAAGAKATAPGLLCRPAAVGNASLCRVLVAAGACMHTAASYGDPPPLAVASNGDVVRVVVAGGASVNAHTLGRNTPLFFARAGDVCQALVDAGADVRATNDAGQTPLHRAVHPDVVQTLVAAGCVHPPTHASQPLPVASALSRCPQARTRRVQHPPIAARLVRVALCPSHWHHNHVCVPCVRRCGCSCRGLLWTHAADERMRVANLGPSLCRALCAGPSASPGRRLESRWGGRRGTAALLGQQAGEPHRPGGCPAGGGHFHGVPVSRAKDTHTSGNLAALT